MTSASEKQVRASQVRKGWFYRAECSVTGSVWVRITQREKWNSQTTKVHFEDCGNGLPKAQFGVEHLSMTHAMLDSDEIVVVSKEAP